VNWLRGLPLFALNFVVAAASFVFLWRWVKADADFMRSLVAGPFVYGFMWGVLSGKGLRRFDWSLALLAACACGTWYYAGISWVFLHMLAPGAPSGHAHDMLKKGIIVGGALGISLVWSVAMARRIWRRTARPI